jgi:hypothetical protein
VTGSTRCVTLKNKGTTEDVHGNSDRPFRAARFCHE